MKSLKNMQFKGFKTSLLLGGFGSLVFGGMLIGTVAGCSDKRNSTPHECKKYPAWDINPSKPIPKPKPKPKPKKDPFKEILLKHTDWYNPFILPWDSKLIMETFPSPVLRDYLIKNLAPKLKYDYTKISFKGGKWVDEKKEKSIIWYGLIKNELTRLRALFITTPLHQVAIDFWVSAQT